MSAAHSKKEYLVMFVVLTVLTAIEVGIKYLGISRGLMIAGLILLALGKATLVALFYMHLKFDDTWFSYLFAFPLLIMVGLAVYLLWLFGIFGTTGIRAS